jgi:hypothetical protein
MTAHDYLVLRVFAGMGGSGLPGGLEDDAATGLDDQHGPAEAHMQASLVAGADENSDDQDFVEAISSRWDEA